jgi:hypothetical protein
MRLATWNLIRGRALMGLVLLLGTANVAAQDLPQSLKDWQGWVLDGEAARTCALAEGTTGRALSDYRCTAVGDLMLTPQDAGLAFAVRVRTDLPARIDLPGQTGRWPHDVRVDAQPAVVRFDPQRQVWSVDVPAGTHQLTGQWDARYDRLAVPEVFARVVLMPEKRQLRREGGQAWLEGPGPGVEAPQVDAPPKLSVWRQLADGQVLRLTTYVSLALAGKAEPINLGRVLPPGFVPVSWQGTLPAVVDAQGQLWIRGGRGNYQLTLMAQCSQSCLPTATGDIPAQALAPPKLAAPWPGTETWSVLGDPSLRQLGIEGAGVDPAQAQVPAAWQRLPAYRVSAGNGLRLRTIARGRVPGEGEQLTVSRTSWATDDGWIHYDHLTGTLPVGGRLAQVAPYTLQRVERAGALLPLTVDGQQQVGLQWPQGAVDAWAQSTSPKGRLAATGWTATVEELRTLLILPPGAALLAAPGAADDDASWVGRFTLISFFGIALLALLMRQALGNGAAIVAGVVAAGWVGQGGAVVILWGLAIIAAVGLIGHALPAGRLRKVVNVMQVVVGVWLALQFIPFAGEQVRAAVYPQLGVAPYESRLTQENHLFGGDGARRREQPTTTSAGRAVGKMAQENSMAMAVPAPMAPPPPSAMRVDSIVAQANTNNAVDGNDPLAGVGLAQVGTPLPTWWDNGLGTGYSLRYVGPLKSTDTLRLWVAPVGLIQLLRMLGTLALAWLGLRLLVRGLGPKLDTWTGRLRTRWGHRLGLALVMGALVLPFAASASAVKPAPVAPDTSVLEELKERLTQPPACAPQCASVAQAQLELSGDTLVATYRVAVAHDSTWHLPTVSGASLLDVRVNEAPAWWTGVDEVKLAQGQARVVARYRAQGDRVGVAFAYAPLQASARGTGWTATGSTEAGGWTWVREKTDAQATQPATASLPMAGPVPGFVQVTRTVTLEGRLGVDTQITRLPGNTGPITVRLPRVPGAVEQSEDVTRDHDTLVATLAAGASTLAWHSTLVLPPNGQLTLKALPADAGIETWRVRAGPAWAVELSGAPESLPDGPWREVRPLGVEHLTITAAKLPAAPGAQQRVDAVGIDTQAGPQVASHTLDMTIVTAQAGERVLGFPDGSQVLEVTVNGQRLSLPLTQGRLHVPLGRGTQQLQVRFRTPNQAGRLGTPAVDLGGTASNARFHLQHPQRRWILATHGPGWGTSVLYWSQLLVLLGVAWALSRLPGTLFSLRTAVLLVLGFSTFPGTVIWLAMLVGWVSWVAWRERHDLTGWSAGRFNLGQLALAGFTALTVLGVMIAIGMGLLGAQPDMMLRAPPGLEVLTWVVSVVPAGPVDGATVISVPLWIYQVALLAWALWFANWLVRAVRRALNAWLAGGYWRGKASAAAPPPLPPKEA